MTPAELVEQVAVAMFCSDGSRTRPAKEWWDENASKDERFIAEIRAVIRVVLEAVRKECHAQLGPPIFQNGYNSEQLFLLDQVLSDLLPRTDGEGKK